MRKLLKSLEAVLVVGLLICGSVVVLRAAVSTAAFDPVAATIGNARLLALGIAEYNQDYDERFPNVQTQAQLESALEPYVKKPSVFIANETGKPFTYNFALEGRSLSEFDNLSTIEIFHDAPTDGTAPLIAYLDQTIERNGVEQGDPKVLNLQHAVFLDRAVQQYTRDYDEKLPDTSSVEAFQAAIGSSVTSSLDLNSLNGQPFVPNPAISGKSLYQFSDPHTTVIFQDTMPYVEGVPTIAYLDGHVTPTAQSAGETDADNLNSLGSGLYDYEQDYQALPPTHSEADFENALLPYTKDKSVFASPDDGLPYVLNTTISGERTYMIFGLLNIAQDAQLNTDGSLNTLYTDGFVKTQYYLLPTAVSTDPAGLSHLLWRDGSDAAALWTLSAAGKPQSEPTVTLPGGTAIGTGLGADGMTRVLWNDGAGAITLQIVGADGTPVKSVNYGPYDGWTPLVMATSATDSTSRILWRCYDGHYALWDVAANGVYLNNFVPSGIPAGTPAGLAVGTDGNPRLLWLLTSGGADILTFNNGNLLSTAPIRVSSGYQAVAYALGADNIQQVLTVNGSGAATILTLKPSGGATSKRSLAAKSGMMPSSLAVGSAGDLRVLFTAPGSVGVLETISTKGSVTGSATLVPYQD